jgi:proteasome lid subunit RPN8/RPN11
MNAVIKINMSVCQQMIKHIHLDVNRECGGYLFGYFNQSNGNIQIVVNGLYYERRWGKENSFLFSPLYEYNAKKCFESFNNAQLRMIGCYHSHAQYPAVFSAEDRELQRYWDNNQCTLIYSPKTREMIGDIITNGLVIPARITVFGQGELGDIKPLLTKKPAQKILRLR